MCPNLERAEYNFAGLSFFLRQEEMATPPPPIDMVSLSRAVNSNVSDVVVLKTYMNSNIAAASNAIATASNLSRIKGKLMGSSGSAAGSGYVSSSGNVWMWGDNGNGQLGTGGPNTDSSTPINISTFGSISGRTIASIARSSYFSMALDTTGALHAWGDNGSGQLGTGTNYNGSTSSSTTPVNISSFGSISNVSITSFSCGYQHTIAIDSTGSLHSWGYNGNGNPGYGQLGNGTTTYSPIPVAISSFGSISGKVIESVASGESFNIAIDGTGLLHAWGFNDMGQLGNGSSGWGTYSTIPIGISSFGSIAGKTIANVACGYYTALAIDSTGSLHAWGNNNYGQLGNGTTTFSSLPISVSTFGSILGKSIKSISCALHCLVVDTSGSIHSWGNNGSGQLGNSSTTRSLIPVPVSTYGSISGKFISAVVCGGSHSLAIDTSGSIHSWGNNNSGQLGNGTTTGSTIPILVPNSTSFTNFTGQHRCFVDQYGTNMSQIEGLIVCANKEAYITTSVALGGDHAFTRGLSAITINDSLPLVSLSQKANDKSVFGVVSLTPNGTPNAPLFDPIALAKQGDLRAEINSVGEGSMWVSNIGGSFASGDLISSSVLPGYGMVQSDDFLHNYTIAKCTISCDFDTSKTQAKLQRRTDTSGNNVLDSEGLPIFDPVLDASSNVILEPLFRYRNLDESGNQIDSRQYETLKSAGSNVYLAAFVGVVYQI